MLIKDNTETKCILIKPKKLKYFDLFPLLEGLEILRPNIKERVFKFLCRYEDDRFRPINGRILNINLFYFGIGDEYPTEYLRNYPEALSESKILFQESFTDNHESKELRLDFNLILSKYETHIVDIEIFPVIVNY